MRENLDAAELDFRQMIEKKRGTANVKKKQRKVQENKSPLRATVSAINMSKKLQLYMNAKKGLGLHARMRA